MTRRSGFEYVGLLLIVACAAFVIFGNSYSDDDGFLTPDSVSYLRLAEHILLGNGFYVPSDGAAAEPFSRFAVWPVGYPTAVAAVAELFSISTFVASKLVNLFAFALAVLLLILSFGRDGLIAALILLSGGTLRNFSMTWSEGSFTLMILALALVIGAVASSRWQVRPIVALLLAGLCLSAFLQRYIGLFTVLPVGLLSIWLYVQGRRGEAMTALVALAVATVGALAYLARNQALVGYATGFERGPAAESNLELASHLLGAVQREFVLPIANWSTGSISDIMVCVLFLGFCAFVLLKLRGAHRKPMGSDRKAYITALVCVAVCYLTAIIFARWTTHFDRFTSRLLDPGFSLLFLAAILWALAALAERRRVVIGFLLVSAITTVIFNAFGMQARIADHGSYNRVTEQRTAALASVPNGAIVLFGGIHVSHLRPDIRTSYASANQTWEEIVAAMTPGLPIYADRIDTEFLGNQVHPSVQTMLESLPEGEFIQIER